MYSWISSAPCGGPFTEGSPGSGMASTNSFSPFISEGLRDWSAVITSGRKAGARRAISTMGPPGTLSTPARIRGSTAMSSVP